MDRIGYYCWAGPGTIRMIKLKYFDPPIDNQSLMSSYDYDYLAKVKETFGITDFWAMYSWGFSEKTELEEYKFLLDRIANFKKLGIKLHAYIQGPNVVYSEFPEIDWYCVDEKDRPITYYRGRRVVCINNPGFIDYKVKQINKMLGLGFEGIYMDNIQMGQVAIPTYSDDLPFVFAGCNCRYCQKLFKDQTGLDIPGDFESDKEITSKYLDFRSQSVTIFLKTISDLVHSKGLEFGVNNYEPKFNTKYEFGTDLQELNNVQDYFLFETHSLPRKDKSNYYIEALKQKITKPIFVVSYKNGVGWDSEFTQEDMDNLFTEDQQCKFYGCIKGSEYCTNGKWHNLYIEHYQKPHYNSDLDIKIKKINQKMRSGITNNFVIKFILKNYFNVFYTKFMETRTWRRLLEVFYSITLR